MRPQDANRERLVQFLRDEDEQKALGFHWNFGDILYETRCGSVGCAVGAAIILGIIERPADDLCPAIGLPDETEELLFYDSAYFYAMPMHSVTASMVADKIEELAAAEVAP